MKSHKICFKNRYGRRKHTALPFHFAIAGICSQPLNSIGSVLRCAWQKAENKVSSRHGSWLPWLYLNLKYKPYQN